MHKINLSYVKIDSTVDIIWLQCYKMNLVHFETQTLYFNKLSKTVIFNWRG